MIYRKNKSETAAIAEGKPLLEKFAKDKKLDVAGPLRVVPYVDYDFDNPPGKDEALWIRLELPVR